MKVEKSKWFTDSSSRHSATKKHPRWGRSTLISWRMITIIIQQHLFCWLRATGQMFINSWELAMKRLLLICIYCVFLVSFDANIILHSYHNHEHHGNRSQAPLKELIILKLRLKPLSTIKRSQAIWLGSEEPFTTKITLIGSPDDQDGSSFQWVIFLNSSSWSTCTIQSYAAILHITSQLNLTPGI